MERFAYPKALRLLPSKYKHDKKRLSKEEARYLLSGRVIIEEKMDGKETLGKAERFIICSEDLRTRHSIAYRVPARFAVFDVFDMEREVFLASEGKTDVTEFYMRNLHLLPEPLARGVFPVKQIARGNFKLEDLQRIAESVSDYAFDPGTGEREQMEGIVVKPDRELLYDEHISGKIIMDEFEARISIHYTRKPKVMNQIDPHMSE